MVDLTKKKTATEYPTAKLLDADTVFTYRPTNAVGEKVFRGIITEGTAASIATGTSTDLKMYSDKALKDALNTGAIPIGTAAEIETGTDTTAKLYAPDQLNSSIDSLIETAVPDGTEAQIIAGTDTTERKYTPTDINGAIKTLSVAQYDSIADIEAITGQTAEQAVYLSADGRSGTFIWDSSDLSTEVAADALQGVYIAPASDATGASGAWVRDVSWFVLSEWYGATGDGTTNDTNAINAALVYSGISLIPVVLGAKVYAHSGLVMPSYSQVWGSGTDVTTLQLISGSESDSISLLNGNSIRPVVKLLTVKGRNSDTSGHGINFTSTLSTSASDSITQPIVEDVLIRECAEDGLRLYADFAYDPIVGSEIRNVMSRYNGGKGIRLHRSTDGLLLRVVSNGNSEEGFFCASSANNKYISCKSYFNADGFNGRGWTRTGCSREELVACEAQEDYSLGFSFFQEKDSHGSILVDANGRVGSEGTGALFNQCEDSEFFVTSTSFQDPTYQIVGIELNENTRLTINMTNNDSLVSTDVSVFGTANDDVFIRREGSFRKLSSGSSSLKELNNFEAGSFTPTIDFGVATSGDLSVSYASQSGTYTRERNIVSVFFQIEATLTFTTSTGNLFVRGLPENIKSGERAIGTISTEGLCDSVTNLISLNTNMTSGNIFSILASIRGASNRPVDYNDVVSGDTVKIYGSMSYVIDF